MFSYFPFPNLPPPPFRREVSLSPHVVNVLVLPNILLFLSAVVSTFGEIFQPAVRHSLYPIPRPDVCLEVLTFRYLNSIYCGIGISRISQKNGEMHLHAIELSYRARPFPGSRCVIPVYKLGDDNAASEISPAAGSFATPNNLRRGDSVGLRGEAVCIRLHISHVVRSAIFASRPRNLVGIQPTARQTPLVLLLASLPSRVAYCRPSSPAGDVESGMGMGNVRDRKIATMMEKIALTASDGSTFAFNG